MCESQGRWELRKVAGAVVDDEQETVFGFLPKLIIYKYRLIEAETGVVGDGGRIEPQFFILFSELGVDPILLSFQDWYLSLILYLRWSCSLVSSFGRSTKPAKQGNEIKTKHLSHKNVVAAIRVKVRVFQERLKIISSVFFSYLAVWSKLH